MTKMSGGNYRFLNKAVAKNYIIDKSKHGWYCYVKEWKNLTAEHPMKAKAKGLRIVTIPLVLFCDDTSGNRSKKWNKFIEWNLTIAGMSLLLLTVFV